MTLMTVLFVFLLASAVLTLTTSSRKITGRYIENSGAYGMAVAGNGYALSFLNGVYAQPATVRDNALALVQTTAAADGEVYLKKAFERYFRDAAMAMYKAALKQAGFNANTFTLNWSAQVNTHAGVSAGVDETWRAVTSITFSANGQDFSVKTTVTKYANSRKGHPVTVTATAVWPSAPSKGENVNSGFANNFDVFKPPVLKSNRAYED